MILFAVIPTEANLALDFSLRISIALVVSTVTITDVVLALMLVEISRYGGIEGDVFAWLLLSKFGCRITLINYTSVKLTRKACSYLEMSTIIVAVSCND